MAPTSADARSSHRTRDDAHHHGGALHRHINRHRPLAQIQFDSVDLADHVDGDRAGSDLVAAGGVRGRTADEKEHSKPSTADRSWATVVTRFPTKEFTAKNAKSAKTDLLGNKIRSSRSSRSSR